MPKPKKENASRARKPMDPDRAEFLRRIGIHGGALLLVLITLSVGFYMLRGHVEKRIAFPNHPPAVVLKNRPAWMSDFVAEQIQTQVAPRGAHSSFDHTMLVEITRMLKTNPWIMKVRGVRRVFGKAPGDTLELDCDFRTPAALVKAQSAYYLIDRNGVRLPEQYKAADINRVIETKDGRTNMLVIDGVSRPAPKNPGQKWTGEDLRAGLDMAAVLLNPANQPFTHEIRKINVSNFNGRADAREAHLVLVTKYGTEIRWGRPRLTPSFEIAPAQKLQYMKLVYEQYGRVDGNQPFGIDIRYDKITYPSMDPQTAQASTDGN